MTASFGTLLSPVENWVGLEKGLTPPVSVDKRSVIRIIVTKSVLAPNVLSFLVEVNDAALVKP